MQNIPKQHVLIEHHTMLLYSFVSGTTGVARYTNTCYHQLLHRHLPSSEWWEEMERRRRIQRYVLISAKYYAH